VENSIIHHEIGRDKLFKIWHVLDEHMFIYTYSEGGSIVCNEKIYPIKRGTLCFIGAGKYHYTMPDNPGEYDRSKLFVTQETFEKIMKLLGDYSRLRNFTQGSLIYSVAEDGDFCEINRIFDELESCRNEEFFEEILMSCCIKLLVLITKNTIEHVPSASSAMDRAINYINSNIFRDMTVDEICAEIHISKYHFCRKFKETTGMTVMNYILKTRIVLAKNLLLHEKCSITDISNRCGFSSISYFCRTFKAEIGMTPLEFRKTKGI